MVDKWDSARVLDGCVYEQLKKFRILAMFAGHMHSYSLAYLVFLAPKYHKMCLTGSWQSTLH